jgi:hypothetical protein
LLTIFILELFVPWKFNDNGSKVDEKSRNFMEGSRHSLLRRTGSTSKSTSIDQDFEEIELGNIQ